MFQSFSKISDHDLAIEREVGDKYCGASGKELGTLVWMVPVCTEKAKVWKRRFASVVQLGFIQEHHLWVMVT